MYYTLHHGPVYDTLHHGPVYDTLHHGPVYDTLHHQFILHHTQNMWQVPNPEINRFAL